MFNFNWIHNQIPCSWVQINTRYSDDKFCASAVDFHDDKFIKKDDLFIVDYANIEWVEFAIFRWGLQHKESHRLRSKIYYFDQIECKETIDGRRTTVKGNYYIYLYCHFERGKIIKGGIQLSTNIWKDEFEDDDESAIYGRIEKDEMNNYYGIVEKSGDKTKRAL